MRLLSAAVIVALSLSEPALGATLATALCPNHRLWHLFRHQPAFAILARCAVAAGFASEALCLSGSQLRMPSGCCHRECVSHK